MLCLWQGDPLLAVIRIERERASCHIANFSWREDCDNLLVSSQIPPWYDLSVSFSWWWGEKSCSSAPLQRERFREWFVAYPQSFYDVASSSAASFMNMKIALVHFPLHSYWVGFSFPPSFRVKSWEVLFLELLSCLLSFIIPHLFPNANEVYIIFTL